MSNNITCTPKKSSLSQSSYLTGYTPALRRTSNVFHQHQLDLEKAKASSAKLFDPHSETKKLSYLESKNSQISKSAFSPTVKTTQEVQNFVTQLLEPSQEYMKEQQIIKIDSIPQVQPINVVPVIPTSETNTEQSSNSQSSSKQQTQSRNIYHYKIPQNQQNPLQESPLPKTFQPGDCLTIQSDLPQSVVQIYKKQQKQGKQSINFIQGYLPNVDYIYYSIEKKLILHRPIAPRWTCSNELNSDIHMQLPDILYNIVQTGVDIRSLGLNGQDHDKIGNNMESGQVIIMCHPYTIQLYYLLVNKYHPGTWHTTSKVFNPICKLHIKLSLPDCCQPTHLFLSGCQIYYLPTKQLHKLTKINLNTGKITKIQLQTSLGNVIPNNNPSIAIKPITKISTYLTQKLVTKLIDLNKINWLTSLTVRYLMDIRTEKIIGCCHGFFMVCVVGVRVRDGMDWLLGRVEHQQIQQLKQQKLINIYTTNPKTKPQNQYTLQNIKLNQHQQILNITLTQHHHQHQHQHHQPKICKCSLILTILDRMHSKIQTHRYQLQSVSQIKEGNVVQIVRLCPVGVPWTVLLGERKKGGRRLSVVVANGVEFGEVLCGDLLVKLGNNQSRTCIKLNIDKTDQQLYLYKCKPQGQSLLLTNTGYKNILPISYLDWLYTKISTYKPQPTSQPIEQLCNYIITNSIALYPRYPISALCVMMNNLLMLAVGCIGRQDCVRVCGGEDRGDGGVLVKCRKIGVDSVVKSVAEVLFRYVAANLENIINKYQIEEQIINIIHLVKQSETNKTNPQLPTILSKIHQNLTTPQPQPQSQQNPLQTKTKISQTSSKQATHNTLPQIYQLSQLILKISLSTTIASFLHQIWHLPLIQISKNKMEKILKYVDCLIGVGEKQVVIGRLLEQDIQKTGNPNCEKFNKSPVSTLAQSYYSSQQHSRYTHPTHTQKPHSNPIRHPQSSPNHHQPHPNILHKLTQNILICQLVKTKNKSLHFNQAYHHSPYYFAADLFDLFVQDYDPELLVYWGKVIPDYLSQFCPNVEEQGVETRVLRYWLGLYVEIMGINSGNKVVKMLKTKWKQYQIISQSAYKNKISSNDNMKTTSKQLDKKQIIIPQFFRKYLQKHKKITLPDITNYQQSNPDLTSIDNTGGSYKYIYQKNQFLINTSNTHQKYPTIDINSNIDSNTRSHLINISNYNNQYRCSQWEDKSNSKKQVSPDYHISKKIMKKDIGEISQDKLSYFGMVKGGIDLENAIKKIDIVEENSEVHN